MRDLTNYVFCDVIRASKQRGLNTYSMHQRLFSFICVFISLLFFLSLLSFIQIEVIRNAITIHKPRGRTITVLRQVCTSQGYKCWPLHKTALFFFVVKDQSCNVQWQRTRSSYTALQSKDRLHIFPSPVQRLRHRTPAM